MSDKFQIPEIDNNQIVEQFARSLVSHYGGEAWKWEGDSYKETVERIKKEIVCRINSHRDLWNVAANVSNFLKNPIALDGSTVAALHYLAGMANRTLEKAKEYER